MILRCAHCADGTQETCRNQDANSSNRESELLRRVVAPVPFLAIQPFKVYLALNKEGSISANTKIAFRSAAFWVGDLAPNTLY